jgi:hypothetical protein
MRYVPLAISALLMAAHFLRTGNIFVVVMQVALGVAAIEWIRIALAISHERAAAAAPATRMFIILGTVALFTLLSALPLRVTPS